MTDFKYKDNKDFNFESTNDFIFSEHLELEGAEMFWTVKNMCDVTRRYSKEPGTTRWTQELLMKLVNEGQVFVARKYRLIDPSWFVRTATLTTVASQNGYQLPWDCGKLLRVHIGSYDFIAEKNWNAALYADVPFSPTLNNHHFLQGNKLVIAEKDVTAGSSIGVVYQKNTLAELHYGTADAIAAGTITLDAVPTVTIEYGTSYAIDDYYNQCRVYIASADTGAGQYGTIADYAGSTKIATMDSDWDTTPTGTVVYSILSELPLSLHGLFPEWAGLQIRKFEGHSIKNDLITLGDRIADTMQESDTRVTNQHVDYIEDYADVV